MAHLAFPLVLESGATGPKGGHSHQPKHSHQLQHSHTRLHRVNGGRMSVFPPPAIDCRGCRATLPPPLFLYKFCRDGMGWSLFLPPSLWRAEHLGPRQTQLRAPTPRQRRPHECPPTSCHWLLRLPHSPPTLPAGDQRYSDVPRAAAATRLLGRRGCARTAAAPSRIA